MAILNLEIVVLTKDARQSSAVAEMFKSMREEEVNCFGADSACSEMKIEHSGKRTVRVTARAMKSDVAASQYELETVARSAELLLEEFEGAQMRWNISAPTTKIIGGRKCKLEEIKASEVRKRWPIVCASHREVIERAEREGKRVQIAVFSCFAGSFLLEVAVGS